MLTLCDTDDIISKLTRETHWVVELVSYNLQTWLYRYCFEISWLNKLWKKFLTNEKHFDRINKLSQDRELKTEFKKIKKCLTNEQRFDKIIKLSQESKTKNIDNWTVRNLERFWESIRTLQWKLKTFKTVNSDSIWMNELAKFNLTEINFLTWEFDPGSGWTLAACLTHASRTKHFIWFPSGLIILWLSGGRVSNAWVTCLVQGDNSWKRLLIPHKRTASHDAVWKTPVV